MRRMGNNNDLWYLFTYCTAYNEAVNRDAKGMTPKTASSVKLLNNLDWLMLKFAKTNLFGLRIHQT